MNSVLIFVLIVVSIFWLIYILSCIRRGKISMKYSMPWLLSALLLLFVSLFYPFIKDIAKSLGFTTSDFIIGVFITILLFITILQTMILTNHKTQIKNLIQEVSILKASQGDKNEK